MKMRQNKLKDNRNKIAKITPIKKINPLIIANKMREKEVERNTKMQKIIIIKMIIISNIDTIIEVTIVTINRIKDIDIIVVITI
jgi:type IV secretory pathway component VirB8